MSRYRSAYRSVRMLSVAAALALAAVAGAQVKKPAVPATMPATVSIEAYPPGDPAAASQPAAAKLKAKLVTVDFKSTPVMTALAELTKQTGYVIKPGYEQWFRGKGLNITYSASNQPFWAVFREVCVRGNINLYNNGGSNDRTVQVIPSNYGGNSQLRASVSIKGPFLTAVTYLERENTVNLAAKDKTERRIHVQMQTYIEPSIFPSEVGYTPVIDEATDDNGNSMLPTNEQNNPNMQSGRGIASYGNFTLPYPTTNPGTRITKIKGHIPARLQMSSESIEVPDPLKVTDLEKTVAGRRVIVNSLKRQGNNSTSYRLEVTLFRDADSKPQDFNRMWNESIGLHLTGSDGVDAPFNQGGGRSSNQESITRFFNFNNVKSPPTKLVIDIPTGVEEIAIPFELVNLPLP